jgi:hypothetical protein
MLMPMPLLGGGLGQMSGVPPAPLLDEDVPPEPAVNLSNRLNPNNIHYDRELAARCERRARGCGGGGVAQVRRGRQR